MTLQDAYNANAGKSVASPDGLASDAGQCVSWASFVLRYVYNHPYIYANAIDWWLYPDLNDMFVFIPFASGVYPQAGDFVVWGSGVGSPFGHIDLCAQDGNAQGFVGYDSNWGDVPILKTIQHNYAYGILGYIRTKAANKMIVDDALARRLLSLSTLMAADGNAPDRQPTTQEVENLIGRDAVDACDQLMSYSPWGHNWNKVKHYDEDLAAAKASAVVGKAAVIAYIQAHLS